MTASTERGESAAGLRLPDFYIVGHPKSGTTAMYEMLRRHPEIFMSELKEPRFFAADLRARFQAHSVGAHPQTIEEYSALFADAAPGQKAGDASPSYLRSRVAAAEIACVRPDARIVAVLREPASFLRSMHLEMVQNRVEDELDLRRALDAEALPPAEPAAAGELPAPPELRYTDRVRYVEQLRRYHEAFPREQVLVLIYDDFRADNEATLREVQRFLGVDDTLPLEAVEANASVRLRSVRMDDAVNSLKSGRGGVGRALKAAGSLVPERARSTVVGAVRNRLVYAEPEPPDVELEAELRRRFAPEVRGLSEYLSRDLVGLWGYDGLD
jgi:hypothetical protein